jgi:hypothetical protein
MAMTHDPTDLSGQTTRTRPAPPPPVMAPPPGAKPPSVVPPPAPPEPTLSWAEQETLDGLRRLARARAQLAAAEGEPAEPRARQFDPTAVAELERIHGELVEARVRASGRFAKGGARARVRELELAERQVLDHLKMASYDDYRARATGSRAEAPSVDPDVVAFARRELDAAERGWQELRELEVAPLEPAAASAPDIDLTTGSTVGDSGVA